MTPDPERWLPMRERSYYRGRKKGKKKDQIGKGTQGATTAATSELWVAGSKLAGCNFSCVSGSEPNNEESVWLLLSDLTCKI